MTKRVAFITGAGRGIGREIARTLSSRGMDIIVTDVNLITRMKRSPFWNKRVERQLRFIAM